MTEETVTVTGLTGDVEEATEDPEEVIGTEVDQEDVDMVVVDLVVVVVVDLAAAAALAAAAEVPLTEALT